MIKKKIVILGSTGSIGKNTIFVLKKYFRNYNVELLSTNKNVNVLINQAKALNVKNLIVSDYKSYILAKKKYRNNNFKFFNNFNVLERIFKFKKIDYSMVSIVGLDGLSPTLKLIKFTKKIAIVNKESLICGWFLIKKELEKYNTKFFPIDSEHFSIFSSLNSYNQSSIEKVFITASGGPFLNKTKKEFKKITIKKALKHPNWKMGKKISIDSATMMNKVFEVIEAKNIFNLKYRNINILIHPKSYIHSIVKFKNGINNIIFHDPDMKIPIYNSLISLLEINDNTIFKSKKIDFSLINKPNLKSVNKDHFPLINVLNNLPNFNSLFETALVTINDFFVNKFLDKKISYNELIKQIEYFTKHNEILSLKKFPVRNIDDIFKTHKIISLKLNAASI